MLVEFDDVGVVICFHFSIFEPLETVLSLGTNETTGCDLLSF